MQIRPKTYRSFQHLQRLAAATLAKQIDIATDVIAGD